MSRVYESMTKIKVGDYTVRVWRDEGQLILGPSFYVIDALMILSGSFPTLHEIAGILETVPQINAYEIIDAAGNGVVVYPEWP